MIKDLNIGPETTKLLEEKIEVKLYDTGFSKDMTPKAQVTKPRIDKWDYIKLKLHIKGHNQQSANGKKILVNSISDKGFT